MVDPSPPPPPDGPSEWALAIVMGFDFSDAHELSVAREIAKMFDAARDEGRREAAADAAYCDVCGAEGEGLRTPVEVCRDCYDVVYYAHREGVESARDEGRREGKDADRVASIAEALDLVESPGTHPIGAPGSVMRRAQDIGRRLETARADGWKSGREAALIEYGTARHASATTVSIDDAFRVGQESMRERAIAAIDRVCATDYAVEDVRALPILPPSPSPPAPDAAIALCGFPAAMGACKHRVPCPIHAATTK